MPRFAANISTMFSEHALVDRVQPAADAGFQAADQAIQTHGGFGYASEYHVERYMREAMLARIAPVSREMILNFIAERVLGLPKSY